MSLYEQISIIIFFGLFLLLAADNFQSSRTRKFFKKGYLEEKKKRADYREEKLIKESDMQVDITSLCMDVEVLKQQSDKILHDLQQIKTRLTWSRKREKKDLKNETKLSRKTKKHK